METGSLAQRRSTKRSHLAPPTVERTPQFSAACEGGPCLWKGVTALVRFRPRVWIAHDSTDRGSGAVASRVLHRDRCRSWIGNPCVPGDRVFEPPAPPVAG